VKQTERRREEDGVARTAPHEDLEAHFEKKGTATRNEYQVDRRERFLV
jgi:hypothetical protein